MPTPDRSLRELIAAYWDCAYQEGVEGRTHDTQEGTAQTLLLDIEAALGALETRAAHSAIPAGYVIIPERPTQAEVVRVFPSLKNLGFGLITAMRTHGLIRAMILDQSPEEAGIGIGAMVPPGTPAAYLFTVLRAHGGSRETFAAVDYVAAPGEVILHRLPLAVIPAAPADFLTRRALEVAEAALSDIGDADREPGDDLAWCEARAAQALPQVRQVLASLPNTPADQTMPTAPDEVTLDMLVAGQEAAQELGWSVPDEKGEDIQIIYDAMWQAAPRRGGVPLDMVLHCPQCGLQHLDAPDPANPGWTNPPHKSHLCHGCGAIWRPADVPTNGVASLITRGEHDMPVQPRFERAIAWHAVCPPTDRDIYPSDEWEFTTMNEGDLEECQEAGYTITPLGKIEAFPSQAVSRTLQQTASQLAQCFAAWEPQVCVMGNVRAQDGLRLMAAILTAPGTADVPPETTAERIEDALVEAEFAESEAKSWAAKATADASRVVRWQARQPGQDWTEVSDEDADEVRFHHPEVELRGLIPWS